MQPMVSPFSAMLNLFHVRFLLFPSQVLCTIKIPEIYITCKTNYRAWMAKTDPQKSNLND